MSTPPTETDLLRAIQLAATPLNVRLLRNNVGALTDQRGRVVRYGVGGNGGSDLIGWTSLTVTPAMVGQRVAIFTAVEGKRLPRRPTLDQMRFLDAVQGAGGLGVVAYAVEDLTDVVARVVGVR